MHIPESIAELRKICQATAPNPARESKIGLFSRKFSIYFTKLFLMMGATPSQLNALSVFTFFVGIGLTWPNNYTLNIVGALVVFLSIIFDGCDGEVARYTKKASPGGTLYAEPVCHDLQYGLGFFSIGVGLFLHGFPWWFMVLAWAAGTFKLLYRLLVTRFWNLTNHNITQEQLKQKIAEFDSKSIPMKIFYWMNKNLFSSTGIFLVLFIVALAGHVEWFLWFFGVGYAVLWFLLFAKQLHRINKEKLI